jgi:type I restriction enzyme S subunit
VYTLLQLSYEQLRELGRGGNQPNLNLSLVKSFEIPLPPIEKQNQFTKMFNQINCNIERISKAIELHDNLFHSLQQRAFKGEL